LGRRLVFIVVVIIVISIVTTLSGRIFYRSSSCCGFSVFTFTATPICGGRWRCTSRRWRRNHGGSILRRWNFAITMSHIRGHSMFGWRRVSSSIRIHMCRMRVLRIWMRRIHGMMLIGRIGRHVW
jgi:hypothetical protein